MRAAWLPQGAGQLLGGAAHSHLRTASGGVSTNASRDDCCLVAVCKHYPLQLWDKAESIKTSQPGLSCDPALLQLVSRLSRGDYPQRVLCTGVGTGGSLAALAALWAAVTYPAAQVRLITFGAPPVSPSMQRHEYAAHFCLQSGRNACCPRAQHVWLQSPACEADLLQQRPALPCVLAAQSATKRCPSSDLCAVLQHTLGCLTLALLMC